MDKTRYGPLIRVPGIALIRASRRNTRPKSTPSKIGLSDAPGFFPHGAWQQSAKGRGLAYGHDNRAKTRCVGKYPAQGDRAGNARRLARPLPRRLQTGTYGSASAGWPGAFPGKTMTWRPSALSRNAAALLAATLPACLAGADARGRVAALATLWPEGAVGHDLELRLDGQGSTLDVSQF